MATTDRTPGGVRDPVAMLSKMYAWTRPGGVMLVQDWDCRTMDIVSRLATWAEFENVMYGVFDRAGQDPRIGLKLPLHVTAAGLGEADGTDGAVSGCHRCW
jgi:hypothetical protein